MGVLEASFTSRLLELLVEGRYDPTAKTGAARRMYFGADRQREWIQPDFWAVLQAHPERLTVLAEIDTVAADLEHNVAKYLWWVSERQPFWTAPTVLISAFTERGRGNYLLHGNIAHYLGQRLEESCPALTHVLVGVRGEPADPDVGQLLAERAIASITTLPARTVAG